ncbi:MAG: pilus assembly protein TadG-related protein, partial [Gemmatimonadaceae bacterium]
MKTKWKYSKPHLENRRGAMLVLLAISMLGLLGLVAIATDIGAGNRQRRIAQTAADAAAIGGGRVIERKGDAASIRASALLSAQKNLFAASEVQIFYPPATGLHIGDINFVEVTIFKKVPTLFGGIFN